MMEIRRRQRDAAVTFDVTGEEPDAQLMVTIRSHRDVREGRGELQRVRHWARYVFAPGEIDLVGDIYVQLTSFANRYTKAIRIHPAKDVASPAIYFTTEGHEPDDGEDDLGIATGRALDALAQDRGVVRRFSESDAVLRARILLTISPGARATWSGLIERVEDVPGVVGCALNDRGRGEVQFRVEIEADTTSAIMRAALTEAIEEMRPAGLQYDLVLLQRCGYCNRVHDDRVACPEYAAADAASRNRCGQCNESHSVDVSCAHAERIRDGDM